MIGVAKNQSRSTLARMSRMSRKWTASAVDEEIALPQGGTTKSVVRVGDTVRRPPSPRAEYVRSVFRLLEDRAVPAPRFRGTDASGRDILSYLRINEATAGPLTGRAPKTPDSLPLTRETALGGRRYQGKGAPHRSPMPAASSVWQERSPQ